MDVTISEVGPRDGLQSIKRTLPTEAKHRWIAALAQAGLREIEVGSFVSPKVLPQMADCAEVVAQARTIPDLCIVVLVPNLRYATMAFEAGTHVITIPVSVRVASPRAREMPKSLISAEPSSATKMLPGLTSR